MQKIRCVVERITYQNPENANEQNLITGTRYMNVEGMSSCEISMNHVGDAIHKCER